MAEVDAALPAAVSSVAIDDVDAFERWVATQRHELARLRAELTALHAEADAVEGGDELDRLPSRDAPFEAALDAMLAAAQARFADELRDAERRAAELLDHARRHRSYGDGAATAFMPSDLAAASTADLYAWFWREVDERAGRNRWRGTHRSTL